MTQSDIIPNEIELERNEIRIELISLFEKRISENEQRILRNAFKFEDETHSDFYARIARQITLTCMISFRTSDIPEIALFCEGLECELGNFRVSRRRVDEIDNIYVSRKRE